MNKKVILIIGIISAIIIIGVIITVIVVLINKNKKDLNFDNLITDNDFSIANKTVTLNNGIKMPILGLGTWTLSNNEAEESVYCAIKKGYRLIDTAEK